MRSIHIAVSLPFCERNRSHSSPAYYRETSPQIQTLISKTSRIFPIHAKLIESSPGNLKTAADSCRQAESFILSFYILSIDFVDNSE